MSYTLGEAAKAVGKSKPTIQRAIKNGKISAKKNDNGTYAIDPSELHRVFEPVTDSRNDDGVLKQSETPSSTILQHEVDLLREQLGRERDTVGDLRRRLDDSEDERRRTSDQLTALLTHQQEKTRSPSPQGRIATAWAALTRKL